MTAVYSSDSLVVAYECGRGVLWMSVVVYVTDAQILPDLSDDPTGTYPRKILVFFPDFHLPNQPSK